MMKKTRTHPDELIIGLVSISDRASAGVYEDQGVPALRDWFSAALSSPWQMETRLIPDEKPVIEKNSEGKDVMINQVGCYGINLGRVDFYFSDDTTLKGNGKAIIVS
jgi:hypothetical protein